MLFFSELNKNSTLTSKDSKETKTSIMSLTEQQRDNLTILSVVTSVISFIAAMSVVITVLMGSRGYCRGVLKGTWIYIFFKVNWQITQITHTTHEHLHKIRCQS